MIKTERRNRLFSTIHALIGYGTDRDSEEIALAPLQVVDCPTQLFHDKYQRTQQGYLPLSRACLMSYLSILGHQKVRDIIAKKARKETELAFSMLKGAPA